MADSPMPKQELLLKLLNMTTAAEDTVAVIAIRKANELLRANGWDWEKLLAGKIKVVADPWGPKVEKPKPDTAPDNSFYAKPWSYQAPPRTAPRPASPPPPPPAWKGQATWYDQTPEHPFYNPVAGNYQRRPYVAAAPSPSIASTRSNMYGGHCYCCGVYVDSGKGWLFKPGMKNEVACDTCNKSSAPVPTKAAKRRTPSVSDILNSI